MSILDERWLSLSKTRVEDVRVAIEESMTSWHGSKYVTTALNVEGDAVRLIHIGTDAQKHGRKTDFVTAVAVLNPGHGAVAWYTKSKARVNSLGHKLFQEVGLSIELALALCEYGFKAEGIDVHIDANTDLKWESGPFHQRLAGMVAGYGFRYVLKPDSWCASHLADHAAKHKNEPDRRTRRRLKKKG